MNTSLKSPAEIAPLISLSSRVWNQPLHDNNSKATCSQQSAALSKEQQDIGDTIVNALQTSGFLLIQSDLMPQELQQQALDDATRWLTSSRNGDSATIADNKNAPLVTSHPTDPKTYVMLEPTHFKKEDSTAKLDPNYLTPTLQKYWHACEAIKTFVLRAIAVGLQLDQPEALAHWHAQGQHSAMRLLHYPPTNDFQTGNRCKAHSDYGTVTLLSTDGVSGLEILLDGMWWPIPHVPGAMVVNIGSLLSEWTSRNSSSSPATTQPQQEEAAFVVPRTAPLLATLHRVAGPASEQSASDPTVLREAVCQGRTSIAFFADPDNDTPLLQTRTSIEDYIHWRSGGSDTNRTGVAFTMSEEELMRGDGSSVMAEKHQT